MSNARPSSYHEAKVVGDDAERATDTGAPPRTTSSPGQARVHLWFFNLSLVYSLAGTFFNYYLSLVAAVVFTFPYAYGGRVVFLFRGNALHCGAERGAVWGKVSL